MGGSSLQYEISVSEQMLEGSPIEPMGSDVRNREIADLTRDAAALKPLLDYCNRLKLSPLHLKDVAEDFVARLSDPFELQTGK